MDYKKHYTLLIERGQTRLKPGVYTERHHIIPRCMGGTDEKDNLVVLTPEEHYLAHQLLVKIYPDNRKLVYAAVAMSNFHVGHRRNNKLYGWLKRKHSVETSARLSGRTLSAEHKQRISEGQKGRAGYIGKDNPMYGKTHTEEACTRISIANSGEKNGMWQREYSKEELLVMSEKMIGENNPMFGKKHSNETKKKMSDARKGQTQPIVICPHCGKPGGNRGMKRYHFDNCKSIL